MGPAAADARAELESRAGAKRDREASPPALRSENDATELRLVDARTGEALAGVRARATRFGVGPAGWGGSSPGIVFSPQNADDDGTRAGFRAIGRGGFRELGQEPIFRQNENTELGRSDEDGRIRSPRLEAGAEYLLSFSKPGFTIRAQNLRYDPEAAHAQHRVELQLRATALGNLAVSLRDERDEAIGNAHVRIERFAAATRESASNWRRVDAQDCNADGHVFFGDLEPGVHRVLVGADAKMRHPILAQKRLHIAEGEAEELALRVPRVVELRLRIQVEGAAPPFGYILLDTINGRAQEPRDKEQRVPPHERNPFMERVSRHLEDGVCSFLAAESGRYDFTFTLGFAGREESFTVFVKREQAVEEHRVRLRKKLADFRQVFDIRSIPLPERSRSR